jgi:hypothetical protein
LPGIARRKTRVNALMPRQSIFSAQEMNPRVTLAEYDPCRKPRRLTALRESVDNQHNEDLRLRLLLRAGGPKHEVYSTSSTFAGPVPNAFCASAAAMNSSRSPSSTAPVLEVETPVRRSFTIW